MPIIRRVGVFERARLKPGEVMELLDSLIKEVEASGSKEKWVQNFKRALTEHRDLLIKIGSFIYPTLRDRWGIHLMGEQIRRLPDYGKDIWPQYKEVLKRVKGLMKYAKNKETLEKLKSIEKRIKRIDLAMRTFAVKLS